MIHCAIWWLARSSSALNVVSVIPSALPGSSYRRSNDCRPGLQSECELASVSRQRSARGLFPPRQRLDPERRRHLVHLLDQRRREWHAVLLAVGAALNAALPRDPDLIDAGQSLRAREIVHMAVDLGLEHIERQEALGIERDHE